MTQKIDIDELNELLDRWQSLVEEAREHAERQPDSLGTAHYYGLANGLKLAISDLRNLLDDLSDLEDSH